jgi:NAD(P)-dependent dehydrogenase (short-subunit alcohol dehydrogenase family)
MTTGKIVLVTGGGTGIGEAAARAVVDQGGAAIVMARREDTVIRVAAEIGERCLAIAGDAGQADDVRRAVALARERFGRLDAVVAAPGYLEPGAVGDIDDDAWRRLIYANLDTAFVTAREALPALLESRGSIVFICSVAGLFSIANNVGYVTAKHAVIGLMRSMVQDYGGQGLRVNTVCPGWVKTPMAEVGMARIMERDHITLNAAFDYVASDVPMARAAAPAEIGGPCAFLVSDAASYINGAVLTIDGGGASIAAGALKY